MSRALPIQGDPVVSFRRRLSLAMMLVAAAVTVVTLYFAERRLAQDAEREFRSDFESELVAVQKVREVRHQALAGLCRSIVKKPRIHAAIEDDALDLLYPSARDELRDLMKPEGVDLSLTPLPPLMAVFYRFLNAKGGVISATGAPEAGSLSAAEEAQVSLPGLSREEQVAYCTRRTARHTVDLLEVIVLPIVSDENQEMIAALAVGFPAIQPPAGPATRRLCGGIWVGGTFHPTSPDGPTPELVARELSQGLLQEDHPLVHRTVQLGGEDCLLFYRRLNPGSKFSPAYEVSLFPLSALGSRQTQLRLQILGAGGLLLAGGLLVSHFLSIRLAVPVERMAVASEEQRIQRQRAEAALELTNEGLRRAVRFSADASHQLKTPVSVMRAGLEELLTRQDLPVQARAEIGDLVHQTYRLSSLIEDLLLLARMDAGRLQLELGPIDLSLLIDALRDDFEAIPDARGVALSIDIPPGLHVLGEQRYTSIILENLLENARKYNCPHGRIAIRARVEGPEVMITLGNTGRPIPAAMQGRLFERFDRGDVGENIPGHGLGLNLARELARIHKGDLRLAGSQADWTEFELTLRWAERPAAPDAHACEPFPPVA
ncbi:MAG TPA: hypothetical protein DCM86_08320 [Verrucomicrobiales bacterium]|nr:hypothetical protein [Verrucomicrobiales bacterium]